MGQPQVIGFWSVWDKRTACAFGIIRRFGTRFQIRMLLKKKKKNWLLLLLLDEYHLKPTAIIEGMTIVQNHERRQLEQTL